ncbi:GNAT family N-acetyltransferase, partial [Candidatus Heimdallarchaeota archaeon]
GIDPQYQGKGFASLLIRSMLTRIDSQQLPCLLETQTAKNVAIYERYDFKVVKETTIPDTSIPHWLMARQSAKG